MMRTLRPRLVLALVTTAMASVASCGDGSNGAAPTSAQATATGQAMPTGQATATTGMSDILTESINEECKARATYQSVIDKFGQIGPFTNIVTAENTHVAQWASLLQRFNSAIPADTYMGKVQAPASSAAACTFGVAVENEDVALYDRLMPQTTNPEILAAMQQPRHVSQDSHLPAFEKCAP